MPEAGYYRMLAQKKKTPKVDPNMSISTVSKMLKTNRKNKMSKIQTYKGI